MNEPTTKQRAHDARVRLRALSLEGATAASLTSMELKACRKLNLAPDVYANVRSRELRSILRAEVRRHHHPRVPLRKLRGRALRRRVAFLRRYGWIILDEPPRKLRQSLRRVEPPHPRLRRRAVTRKFRKPSREMARDARQVEQFRKILQAAHDAVAGLGPAAGNARCGTNAQTKETP